MTGSRLKLIKPSCLPGHRLFLPVPLVLKKEKPGLHGPYYMNHMVHMMQSCMERSIHNHYHNSANHYQSGSVIQQICTRYKTLARFPSRKLISLVNDDYSTYLSGGRQRIDMHTVFNQVFKKERPGLYASYYMNHIMQSSTEPSICNHYYDSANHYQAGSVMQQSCGRYVTIAKATCNNNTNTEHKHFAAIQTDIVRDEMAFYSSCLAAARKMSRRVQQFSDSAQHQLLWKLREPERISRYPERREGHGKSHIPCRNPISLVNNYYSTYRSGSRKSIEIHTAFNQVKNRREWVRISAAAGIGAAGQLSTSPAIELVYGTKPGIETDSKESKAVHTDFYTDITTRIATVEKKDGISVLASREPVPDGSGNHNPRLDGQGVRSEDWADPNFDIVLITEVIAQNVIKKLEKKNRLKLERLGKF